jgi:hypothetical protein
MTPAQLAIARRLVAAPWWEWVIPMRADDGDRVLLALALLEVRGG